MLLAHFALVILLNAEKTWETTMADNSNICSTQLVNKGAWNFLYLSLILLYFRSAGPRINTGNSNARTPAPEVLYKPLLWRDTCPFFSREHKTFPRYRDIGDSNSNHNAVLHPGTHGCTDGGCLHHHPLHRGRSARRWGKTPRKRSN